MIYIYVYTLAHAFILVSPLRTAACGARHMCCAVVRFAAVLRGGPCSESRTLRAWVLESTLEGLARARACPSRQISVFMELPDGRVLMELPEPIPDSFAVSRFEADAFISPPRRVRRCAT